MKAIKNSKMKMRACSLLFVLPILFLSCGKKWKETTSAEFSFSINRSATNNGHVSFIGGDMRIAHIEFSGTRKRGDAVAFNSETVSTVDLGNGGANPTIRFDIPQGTYTNITMQFRAEAGDTCNSSLILLGKYAHGPNDTVPVYFYFNPAQVFSVQAENANGGSEITFVKDKPVTATVAFDPVYWFDAVTYGQLQAANHVPVNSVASIVIDQLNNPSLYQNITNRIGQSTRLIFNQ